MAMNARMSNGGAELVSLIFGEETFLPLPV